MRFRNLVIGMMYEECRHLNVDVCAIWKTFNNKYEVRCRFLGHKELSLNRLRELGHIC